MNTNAFIGRSEKPTEADLALAPGPAEPVWRQLLVELQTELGVNIQEWKSYSPKYGWTFRAQRGKRTIVWLTPHKGSFEVLFILGEKAMRSARQTRLPQCLVKAMDKAPKYPEGTGVRLNVKSSRDIGALAKLATIKVANGLPTPKCGTGNVGRPAPTADLCWRCQTRTTPR